MKRSHAFISLGGALLLACGVGVRADLVTIGFDDLTDGDAVTDQYQSLGVVFSTHAFGTTWEGDPLDSHPVVYRDSVNGQPGVLVFDSYCYYPEYVQAEFSVPVDSVSVQITPFEGSEAYPNEYRLGVELYDAADQLIIGTHVNAVYTGGVDPWTLGAGILGGDVAYARFFGYYPPVEGSVNAVTFDNFAFNTTAVPDVASTFSLLVLALAGLVGLRRRK